MDAVIFNIDHFHLINEMYGRRTGDEVLKKLAQILTDIFGNIAGIGCRAEADTFYVYCQHQFSYDHRMVKLFIDIAKFLDVPVVAEGVEDEIQVNTLKKMGCDVIQGFYFSKPVPPEEFEKFIIDEA